MKEGITNLLGVVLCGGESKRMGRDKGLMPSENKTWAERVAGKLAALEMPVVVSVNPQQLESYQQLFSSEQLVVDNLNIDGPLLGLLSVHQQYPDKDLLVLACDMIDMDRPTLNKLLDAYSNNGSSDFFAYYHDGFLETLCAIYRANALQSLLQEAQNQTLKHFSLIRVLEHGVTHRLTLESHAPFHNYNSRTELTFPDED